MRLVKEISAAIKDYRHHTKVNQDQFGNLVGVKQSQVARWEGLSAEVIPDKTWEALYPVIEPYLPAKIKNKSFTIFESSTPYSYNQSFLPLPRIIMLGKNYVNYQKRAQDKVFGYIASDMEPIVPANSSLLVHMLEEEIKLSTKKLSLIDIRIRLPHNELVVLRWDNEEEFRIRRVIYKSENDKNYKMHLIPGKANSKKALKVSLQEKVTFYGFVKAIVNKKVTTKGFIN